MVSDICVEGKYLDQHTCKRCETLFPIKKGFEFTPNCGRDDYGSQLYHAHRKCSSGTFNDGSFVKCEKCNSCPSPQLTAAPCVPESDVVCCKGENVLDGRCIIRHTTVKTTSITTERKIDPTSVLNTDPSTSPPSTSPPSTSPPSTSPPSTSPPSTSPSSTSPPSTSPSFSGVTAICVTVGILSVLALLFVLCIKRRQTRRTKQAEKRCNGEMEDTLANESNSRIPLFSKINENGCADHKLLAAEVQAAPLSTVLNNLDVLEELILLLDPDISGAKNTRHLAAKCSFSFAWINYAYSKKEHKSPLATVLEGVVAKNPDWTVGHFAGLLRDIGRNDAVEVLAKLTTSKKE